MTPADDQQPAHPAPRIEVHVDAADLATAVAGELIARLEAAQARGEEPQIGLTGGSIADGRARGARPDGCRLRRRLVTRRALVGRRALRGAPTPTTATPGRRMPAFGDRLAFDPAKVHEVPSTADASSVDDAAAAYSAQLREHGAGSFEVLMLGMGPDGHVASLFPGSPQLDADDQVAVGVTGSPKPPPERVSLTFAALNRSRVGLVPGQRRGQGRRRRPRAVPRHRPPRDPGRRRHRRGSRPSGSWTARAPPSSSASRHICPSKWRRVGTSAPQSTPSRHVFLAGQVRRDETPLSTATCPTCAAAPRSTSGSAPMGIASWRTLAFLDHTFPLPLEAPFTYALARASRCLGQGSSPNSASSAFSVDRSRVCTSCRSSATPSSCEPRPCASSYPRTPSSAIVMPAGCTGPRWFWHPTSTWSCVRSRCFGPSGMGRLRIGLADSGERNLTPEDIVELHGLRVTSPLRTAWDLGRQRSRDTRALGHGRHAPTGHVRQA